MSAVATAIVGSAVVGGILAKKSADTQANAARSAASTQAASADKATELQREMYYQNREDLAPWLKAGERSLGDLEKEQEAFKGLINDPSSYTKSPDYNFLLDQGVEALTRGGQASGLLDSGAHLKDLVTFGQGLASTGYNDAVNRKNLLLNRYAATSGVGQTTAGQLGTLGSQTAGNIGNLLLNKGNALATGDINAGNARTSFYQNVGNQATNLGNNLLFYNALNPGGGGGGGYPGAGTYGVNPGSINWH